MYVDDEGTRIVDNALLVYSCNDVEFTNQIGWRVRWVKKGSAGIDEDVDVDVPDAE